MVMVNTEAVFRWFRGRCGGFISSTNPSYTFFTVYCMKIEQINSVKNAGVEQFDW